MARYMSDDNIKAEQRKAMIEFGKRVQELRQTLGVSQLELALNIGYKNDSGLSKLEQGKHGANPWLVKALCRELGCTTKDLFGI